ncbi:MAG: right-handed parallel beta-helix repeat-containing protein [Clostridiales bacterium]|nr:right-handed parallel beta-helix repeat-containing protein [Clostridiales bacterium]
MKFFKTAVITVCIIALAAGSVACAAFRKVSLPEERTVLVEPVPEENELRGFKAVDGVGGSRFYISSPKEQSLKTVPVSQFGVDPENEDNTEALNSAFAFCAENSGINLMFDKAVYLVSGALEMKNVTDALINGNGATILYDHGSSLLSLRHCECVKICGLTFEWNWDKIPLSAIARAVNVKGEKNTLDFVFDNPEYAREDMLYAVSQCDPEYVTYGGRGTYIESYDGQNPEVIKSVTKIGDDTLRVVHNGAWAHFGGNSYILRSTAYGGSLIDIYEACRDITLDSLKLYGGTGMGIIVGERSSHFALENIFIGPDPEKDDDHFTSLDADAVHISDSDGCFLIENCDFSRQGDDDVNINSGIGFIHSVSGKTVVFEADGSMNLEPGETAVFRDKNFNLTDITAVAEKCESTQDGLRQVTFSEDLPKSITKGCFLFNRDNTGSNYVIRNNYFHEHRARGLLLQTSDGLVENNVFYKTTHNAIKIIMDINGVWHEGTGADNIVVRNNKFIECSVIGTEIIEVGTHLLDKSNGSYAFTNIRIEDNEFKDICGNLMVVNNVNGFVFKGNTVTLGKAFRNDLGKGRSYFLADCVNVSASDNIFTDASSLSLVHIARSNSPVVWLRVNAAIKRGKDGAK